MAQCLPVTSDFGYRMDDIRAIVSPDRLTAIGMGVFDSTGYHEDGTPYGRRPARSDDGCAVPRPDRRGLARCAYAYVAVSRRAEPLLRQEAGRLSDALRDGLRSRRDLLERRRDEAGPRRSCYEHSGRAG